MGIYTGRMTSVSSSVQPLAAGCFTPPRLSPALSQAATIASPGKVTTCATYEPNTWHTPSLPHNAVQAKICALCEALSGRPTSAVARAANFWAPHVPN
jgi:hypothetical protein